MSHPLKIFISFSSLDQKLKQEFSDHLKVLEHSNRVEIWEGHMIKAGSEWDEEIRTKIISSDLFIILLSKNSLVSEYINTVELSIAMREKKNIVPIILKPCNWLETSISRYQCLPRNGKAISTYKDRDKIFTEVIQTIKKDILSKSMKNASFSQSLCKDKIYESLEKIAQMIDKTILLMKILPLKKEQKDGKTAIYIDQQSHKKEIYKLMFGFIVYRNELLDSIRMNKTLYRAIEKITASIFTYISLNRIGYDVDEDLWRSVFEYEILNLHRILTNKIKL